MAGINNQILGELDLQRLRCGLEIIASAPGRRNPGRSGELPNRGED